AGRLQSLVERVESLTIQKQDPIGWLMPEFSSLVREPEPIWDINVLRQQAETLVARWFGDAVELARRGPADTTSVIVTVPALHERASRAFEGKATLTTESLRAHLNGLNSQRVGVIFGWSSDGRSTRIHLGTYLRGDGALPRSVSPGELFKQIDLF